MKYLNAFWVCFGFIGLFTIAASYFGFTVDINNTQLFGVVVAVFAIAMYNKTENKYE